MDPAPESFDRYLRLLAVDPGAPDLDLLTCLVDAQVRRVPFENVSKLYSVRHHDRRELPTLEAYLDGIERYRFGGTCYINNNSLHRLLVHLGYDASFCGARMGQRPDVHTVILVRVGGEEYLVDSGYGAPFHQPLLRRQEGEQSVELGRDRYVLHPVDKRGCSRMEHYRNGELIHGYLADPTPRTLEHFAEVIDDSYSEAATFMNALIAYRFFSGRSVAVLNDELIESAGGESRITLLPEPEDRVNAIVEHFGMPREIVLEATAGLVDLRGVQEGPIGGPAI